MRTIYICNVCGEEHRTRQDAIECHPDIIEREGITQGLTAHIDTDIATAHAITDLEYKTKGDK